MKVPLFFMHGNGFPAKSYSKMLRHLQAGGFSVDYLDRIGHNPKYPVTERWPHLIAEFLDTVTARYKGEKIIALGHCLGGFISFMAAVERPELFKGVIMLDSPLIGPVRGTILTALKRTNLSGVFIPGQGANRKSRWPSLEEARKHFHTRLTRFDKDSLEDYVMYGTEPDPPNGPPEGQRVLSFRTQIEADINSKMPLHYNMYEGRIDLPLGFIGGSISKERFMMGGNGYMRRKFGVVIGDNIPGTHLYPLEHPIETADAVMDMVRVLGLQHSPMAQASPEDDNSSSGSSSRRSSNRGLAS